VIPLPSFFHERHSNAQVLAKLDLAYVRARLVREALHEAFGGSESGYDVEVRETAEGQGNYQRSTEPDAVVQAFRLRPDALAGFHTMHRPEGASAGFGIVRDTTPGRPTIEPAGMLSLRFWHRAGSVEAAVARIRNRDLFIAFAIEAILAASIILLARSMRRRGELAARQIAFVAGLSHDLATPLAVIRTLAQNQARGLLRDSERVVRYGEAMLTHLLRLTDTLDKALRFAGLRSGRLINHKVTVNVTELIQRAVELSHAAYPDSAPEIEVVAGASIPEIAADPEALSRAFQNLIANAIKYSPKTSRITIRVGVQNEAEGQPLEVAVEDRGCGIPPREISKIFEPFYRAPSAMESNIGGTGLGLTLVKAIVEAHGGSVTCTSTPGSGSTFVVRLPGNSERNGSAPR
jgi:signal transduction histidine kinase